MSIQHGFTRAIDDGESIGCTAIQIFTKSNRQWKAKKLHVKDTTIFIERQKASFIQLVTAHASYLINLGSPDKHILEKSCKALHEELMRCNQLNIPYLVLHPGSRIAMNETKCLNQIADSLDTIFAHTQSSTMLLLENTAGQGSTVCYTFEQLAHIFTQSRFKKRLGFCLDTCHAFAAGYDFRTPKKYDTFWKQLDSLIGLKHLKVIHINDSKKDFGSRIDRHEDIGKGKIGLQGFKYLMNDEQLFTIPKILETPRNTLADYERNLKTLKDLLTKATQKKLNII